MLITGSNILRKKSPSYKGFPMFSPSAYLSGTNRWPKILLKFCTLAGVKRGDTTPAVVNSLASLFPVGHKTLNPKPYCKFLFWHMKVVDESCCLLACLLKLQVSLLVPGNYQGPKRISQTIPYTTPGVYQVKVPCVSVRTTGSVLVEMVDKNGLYFSDEFSLTFHMRYYRLLKWLICLPFVGMVTLLIFVHPPEGTPLPSFSHQL